ncbi:MAG: SWIM zinc finger family protein, partial [Nostocales cyanobacterium LE14-WE12]|nr:SWIM zinc finger family protein [Nostocales cyanobacterium LE14-WE12]
MSNETLQASREWWSQRWLDLLDSYRFKKRLERARNYSRQGNVLSIKFKAAKVLARVQGSEVEPYKVSLSLDAFSDEEWGYVVETISQKAIFAAKLLAGEMPQNIEEVFISNGLSLFPFTLTDIHSKCSCPDQVVPCKHIGAVYYQLGDHFSEDPFVLFQLRGRTKEQIISDLRQLRSSKNVETIRETSEIKPEVSEHQYPIKIDNFWQYNQPLESSLVVISPAVSETVLDVLGTIP